MSRALRVLASFSVLALAAGCFMERSFRVAPLVDEQIPPADPILVESSSEAASPIAVAVTPVATDAEYAKPSRPTAREWLVGAHASIESLLPKHEHRTLLTQDIIPNGQPIDVYAHFNKRFEDQKSVFSNFEGLQHSAQATSWRFRIDEELPPWPGFRDVTIPLGNYEMFARLGLADRNGIPIDADCVVILPGILGDTSGLRTRDMAEQLRASGLHVLAIEMRGHGRTELRNPDVRYTFGLIEVGDLMHVSDWAESQPHVRRTGLIGFCWGGSQALLTAWFEGRAENDPFVVEKFRQFLPPPSSKRRFSAGVMSISPVLNYDDVMDALDVAQNPIQEPVLATIQKTIASRAARKGCSDQTGNLRHLIDCDLSNSELRSSSDDPDLRAFLRLMEYKGLQGGDKLESARMPVLILNGINDPLCSSQRLAEFMATIDNPNVAAMVLPGGGHVGFAPYAKDYYYRLIVRFFDSKSGAAADPAPAAFVRTAARDQ